jgi:transposase
LRFKKETKTGGKNMPQMLLPIFTEQVSLINQLIGYAKRDGRVYYFNGQMPLFVHDEEDQDSFKMFMAQLYVTGNASQAEINRAFGLNAINMKRWVKKYQEGGPGAFYKKEKERKPRVMMTEIIKTAQELLDKAHTKKEVAEGLGLKVDTLRKAIREGKLQERNDFKKKKM